MNYCKCSCGCIHKLLTTTSVMRNRCSDCVIGNCKGKNLISYYGGRFEVTKPTQISFDDIKSAYPFSSEVEDKGG